MDNSVNDNYAATVGRKTIGAPSRRPPTATRTRAAPPARTARTR